MCQENDEFQYQEQKAWEEEQEFLASQSAAAEAMADNEAEIAKDTEEVKGD